MGRGNLPPARTVAMSFELKGMQRKMNRLNALGLAFLLILGVFAGSGCDKIGQSPPGASADEEKAMFDKLPIEERAKQLMALPGPQADKIAKVKAMYEKEGKKMPEDFGSTSNTGPANGPPVHG